MWTRRHEEVINVLKKHNQEELANRILHSDIDLLSEFSESYAGGLDQYLANAVNLLQRSQDTNSTLGFDCDIKTPDIYTVDPDNVDELHELDMKGLTHVKNLALVCVAGGLGERLGFSDVKLNLAPTGLEPKLTCLQYYCEQIKHLQNLVYKYKFVNSTADVKIPLLIMTSDDTHNRTLQILQDAEYYGLQKSQVHIHKQQNVPAIRDLKGNIATANDKVIMKPHGHGDVHKLMYSSGIYKQWKDNGIKYIFFFQDTNILSFRTLLSMIAVSSIYNLAMNTAVTHRTPGEKTGSIVKLYSRGSGAEMVCNVEYCDFDEVLKSNGISEEPLFAGTPYSVYPGNTNMILFDSTVYFEVLERTHGEMPEFVNPKFTDSTKRLFKSPARLETMLQDFARLLPSGAVHGCTMYPRWFAFSPIKNSPAEAQAAFNKGCPTDCRFSGDADFRFSNYKMLTNVYEYMFPNSSINQDSPVVLEHNGIPRKCYPPVYLQPAKVISYIDIISFFNHNPMKELNLNHTNIFTW